MKYFIRNKDPLRNTITTDICHETTVSFARRFYENYTRSSEFDIDGNMISQYSQALFEQGKRVTLNKWKLWGEDISDKELFKQRLNGTVGKEILT